MKNEEFGIRKGGLMQGSELEIIEVLDDVIVVEVSNVVIEVDVAEDVIEVVVGEGALTTEWGSITGTLGNQRDLQDALDEKEDISNLGGLAYKSSVDWDGDIDNIPSAFPPAAHDHDDRYYTEGETDSLLAGKSDVGHDHDGRYYTEAETDSLLAGKSDTGHTHDDRYYTETETDSLLAGKSDTGHTHDDRYYTEAEVDTALNLKAPKASPTFTGTPKAPTAAATTNNTQIATTAFVQRGLAGKSDSDHTHDDRYYTEAETDSLLAGKSDVTHNHDGVYLPIHGTADNAVGLTPILLEPGTDLNDLRPDDVTWYRVGSNTTSATILNKPFTTNEQFTMAVYRTGNATRIQVLMRIDGIFYSRYYRNDTWNAWVQWNMDYRLPAASASVLGGVMVGRNLSADAAGVLSADATGVVCDASGNPASFSDGAPAPVVELTAGIEPVQDLHGYDAPWPGGAGKNLWNPVNVIVGGVSSNAISSTSTFRTVFFAVEEGKTYTMSKVVSNRFRYGYTKVLPTNGTAVFDGNNSSQDGNASITVTVPTGQGYLYIACCVGTYADADDFLPIFGSFQAEEGSSATSYEPYANICPISGWTGCGLSVNGSPVSVSLPSGAGTVYGGSLDVTAGVLTVDRVAEVFDGSDDENWTKYSDSTTHYYIDVQNLPDKSKCNWGEGSTNIYPWATNASGSAIKVARFQNLQPQSYVFYCVGTGIESLAEFKAFLNNTPLQVCYKIAAPVTYQLDPTEISTILGQNTISADTGPVELRYRADTKLYIDGKFAELQALILEN